MAGTVVKKRGKRGKVAYRVELGYSAAYKCDTCPTNRSLTWPEGNEAIEVCARCGGPVRQVQARRRPQQGGHANQRAAGEALTEICTAVHRGEYVPPSALTCGRWWQAWLEQQRGHLKPSTYRDYAGVIRVHLSPMLCNVPLRKLRPEDIETIDRRLREAGRTHRTRVKVYTVINKSLKDAVRRRRIAWNPADAVGPPPRDNEQPLAQNVFDAATARAFLDFTREDPWHILYLLALQTGLRRGELAGLRWSDLTLDDDSPSLRVERSRVSVDWKVIEGSPKSKRGKRTIALTPEVVAALRARRKQQTVVPIDGYLFTDGGEPVHPDAFSKSFERAQATFRATRADIPRLRFHDLRRTAGSLWILAGVEPVVVSRMLGHSSVAFTLDVYVSVLPDQSRDAAMKMAALLGVGRP